MFRSDFNKQQLYLFYKYYGELVLTECTIEKVFQRVVKFVFIKTFAHYRKFLEQEKINYVLPKNVNNIEELFYSLVENDKRFEKILFKNKRINTSNIILLNGKNIFSLRGVSTPVKEKDELSIIPPMFGG